MPQCSVSLAPEAIESVNAEAEKEKRPTSFSSMVAILVDEALAARKVEEEVN